MPRIVRAIVDRYRELQIEYFALKVVGRGLFLVLILMVGFLFILSRATDLITGVNEIVVPTVQLSADVDLGSLVASTFSRVSGAVLSVSAVFILVASAMLTAHALRQGSALAVGAEPGRARMVSWRTAATAVVVALLIMATWIVALATSLRHRAWVTLLGQSLPEITVNLGKALVIVGIVVVLAATMGLYAQRLGGLRLSVAQWLIAMLCAAVTVGASFLLLYTYIGALINPHASTGVIFVVTLLLWVNVVVRAYFVGLCWIVTSRD